MKTTNKITTEGDNPNCRREIGTNNLIKNPSHKFSRIPTPQQLKLLGSGDRGLRFFAFFLQNAIRILPKKRKKARKKYSEQFSVSNFQLSKKKQKNYSKKTIAKQYQHFTFEVLRRTDPHPSSPISHPSYYLN